MKFSWHLKIDINTHTHMRGQCKVNEAGGEGRGGDAQLPFAINGNAKAHAHTHEHTRTQAQWVLHMPWQRIYRMLWGKHFATHMKSFWQTSIYVSLSLSLYISVSLYAAFPINFHLQRACKFPSFSATLLLICANWQSEKRDTNICIERVLLSLPPPSPHATSLNNLWRHFP